MTLNELKFQTAYLSLDSEFYDMTDPTPLDDPYLISFNPMAAELIDSYLIEDGMLTLILGAGAGELQFQNAGFCSSAQRYLHSPRGTSIFHVLCWASVWQLRTTSGRWKGYQPRKC